MIRMIPRLMGPRLGKAGKFPVVLRDDVSLAAVIETQLRTVKGLLQRQPCFDFAGAVSHRHYWRVCGMRRTLTRGVWWDTQWAMWA
jgi:hypothetical protein